MFRRFTRLLRVALPFSIAVTTHLFGNPLLSMNTQINYPQSEKIKIINDIEQYSDNGSNPDKAVILCQLHDDDFIDSQLVQLAHAFQQHAKDRISTEFQFLFVKGQKSQGQEFENYFVIYTNRGQKIVSLDAYLNHNRQRPGLQANTKALMSRLIQTINGYRELRQTNIVQEISAIENTSNYASLLIVPDQKNEVQVENQLVAFLKQNQIKSRNCHKIVVKDQTSKTILGLNGKGPGVYLLAAVNDNILPEFKQDNNTFKVGQKQCFITPVHQKISQMFVFPPIQPKIPADELVLNVYVNKNNNTTHLEHQIRKELAKPQYNKFHKALYYSGDFENAAIVLELNDYSQLSLTAFDEKKGLEPARVKQILSNSYEWNYEINSPEKINSQAIKKWIQNSTGQNKWNYQNFKTQKKQVYWATPLTGSEYKQKRDEPNDKVIYHFSEHCHGCKKFGGKYELFAKSRHMFPGLKFYRINNDHNKAQGVRNYNSTPIFVYYKQGCTAPFIYKQPIFTEDIFEDFLKITGSFNLIDYKTLHENIRNRQESDQLVKEILKQLK